jgi:hypothetical protein
MGNRYKLILVFLFVTAIGHCQQNSKYAGGIVYGPKAAFQIYAPDEWVLDNQAGINLGLHCVLYLKGYNWSNSPVIMYAKIASTNFEKSQLFIEYAIKEFQNKDTSFTFSNLKNYETKDKYEVIVNDYTQNSHTQFDRVAYIQVKNAVCYIVFSTAQKSYFDKHADNIYKVVDTFEYKPEFINYGNK